MKRINYLLIVLSLLSVMACAGNDKITSDANSYRIILKTSQYRISK